jgi:hypothetical protein
MNSSCLVRVLFPFLAKPTVGSLNPLAHRTLSGAHRTVRCDYPIIGSATCRLLIAQTTVGRGRLWLIGQSGAPPDSPVIFSRDTFSFSREQRVHRWRLGHGRWRLTGQSGGPPDNLVIYCHVSALILESRHFAAGPAWAPDTVRCTTRQSGAPQDGADLAEPSHLFLSSFFSFLGHVSST